MFSPGVVLRLAGPSRVETAAGVSRRVFSQADAVMVARADRYPDALAASPVAASVGAPLLLTPSGRLHPSAAAEIQRLGAATAYLMGDRSALSAQVERDLRAIGVRDVVRVAGANRYDTARLAATRVGGRAVYVVEGAHADPARGWPDAVSVSALAAFQRRPILLVEQRRLPEETVLALRELEVTEATIVGGTAAVSTEVADRIAAEGIAVDRVAGATRYDTSRQVADVAVAAGMNPASTWLSSGRAWPDALSAGPAAGAQRGVLLLINGTDLDAAPPARSWLDAHRAAFERITVVGGPDVVWPRVAVQVEQAVR